jgi:hypothetical protein
MKKVILLFTLIFVFAACDGPGSTTGDGQDSGADNGSPTTPPDTGSGGSGPDPVPASGGAKVQLSWSAFNGQQLGFKIEVSADGINYSPALTVPDGITTATVAGLTAGKTYKLRVKGYSEGGNSLPSAVLTATAH